VPTRASRPCATPRCPNLTQHGPRCTEHTRAKEKARGTRQQRGYDAAHERWAKAVLNRDPCCLHCEADGVTTPATHADHIVPWQDGGAKLDIANGQGLCGRHHGVKTRTENR
jgi:5-methylcytosine-specific restriction protein A